mmetsp:Transcript_24466/g.47586  ORF Transcript_24466/g.47586 Transcript_24466/m.47586 type:complete len:284 (+) Transcript_24466:62-913(+)|eukprot:CAMPEP_0173380838 /NCGR_PEP_ID=MMETSP1356-20130122/3425_1 /TAXON_ID=77927 ORGANISM="Hemiselmis virescens, Strain PCC157" /NCGR_SAMPLE_ID=MMETSP1356 /ASSEMBLY_ACC=CAM_ASM_000847 /LENGTH=283 /DNA_ID=CAMNT_0014334551 /DNA_START=23 /DNA_END=874 /DNA_ORIENTATION=+
MFSRTQSGQSASKVDKDALTAFQQAHKKKKEEMSALDMDINQLFKTEPSWRGARRKNLLAQRMGEAEEEHRVRVGKGKQELWEAARVGNFDRIMDLLFRSKDYIPTDGDLGHSIHNAAAKGREDALDLLIRHGADPCDQNMPMGFSPVMVAATKGHVHAMLLLIDRGGEVNAKNEMQQTAMHIAALRGHAHIIKALVAEGAEAWHKDMYGRTAYDCCKMETEEHALCRDVLINAVPKPKAKKIAEAHEDTDGTTPAHHWLCESMHGEPRECAMNGLDMPTNMA